MEAIRVKASNIHNCVRSRINASAFGIIAHQQNGSSPVAEAFVYLVDGQGGSIRRGEIMAQVQFVMIDTDEGISSAAAEDEPRINAYHHPPTVITSSPITVVDDGDAGAEMRLESTAISKFLRELRILSPCTNGRRLNRRRPYVNEERDVGSVASNLRNSLAARAGERLVEADDDCCTLIDYSNSTTSNSEGEEGHTAVGVHLGWVEARCR